jgi:predicted Zn finger-like uncharacterized protein
MILTCQKCTKRYLVDSESIGQEGRTVRCVSCGHVWTQPPSEDRFLKAVNSIDDDLQDDPPSPSSPGLGWGWASFIVVLLALTILFITGREYISRQWPTIQPLYQRLGFKLPKPGAGLSIKNAFHLQQQKDGRRYIVVKGEIVNTQQEARAIPPLRIYLRGDCSALTGLSYFLSNWHHHTKADQHLCILKTWTHTFSETRLLPGEKLSFETSPLETTAGVESIEIRF